MVLNVCFVGKSFSCRSFCTGVFDMTLGWSLVTFIHAYESPGNGSKVFGAIGTSFSEDTWAHEAVGQGGSLEQNKAIRRKPKKDAYRSPHKRTGSTVICNVSKRYTVDCRCCCFPVFQPHESWNYIYIYLSISFPPDLPAHVLKLASFPTGIMPMANGSPPMAPSHEGDDCFSSTKWERRLVPW